MLGYAWDTVRFLFLDSWLFSLFHLLLPVTLYLTYKEPKSQNEDMTVFIFACVSLAPFAERLGAIVDQLSMHVGDFMAAMLNISLGNTSEVVVVLVGVFHHKSRVAADVLVGGMLSELLLVGGIAVTLGGLRGRTMTYDSALASAMLTPLLLFALVISCISAMPSQLFPDTGDASDASSGEPTTPRRYRVSSFLPEEEEAPLTFVSRVASVIAICFYGIFTVFLVITNQHKQHARGKAGQAAPLVEDGDEKVERGDETVDGPHAAATDAPKPQHPKQVLGLWGALFWLAVVIGFIALLTDSAINALDGAVQASGMTHLFLCGVLLPSVSNAPSAAVATRFALRERFDLVIASILGASAQTAHLLLPLTVIADWVDGGSLHLAFPEVEHVALFMGVLVTILLLQGGRATWMHGLSLIFAYVIIASAWFFKPRDVYLQPDSVKTSSTLAFRPQPLAMLRALRYEPSSSHHQNQWHHVHGAHVHGSGQPPHTSSLQPTRV